MQQFFESIISNFIISLSQLYSTLFIRVDPWIIWLIIISLIAFIAISIILGIRAHHKPVSAGREDLVGRTAVVDTALNPQGLVLVEGERWRAILDKGSAEPEDEVIITKVEGLTLRVNKGEIA
jgi:membrane-bound serine protease (ClpP class)